MRLKLRDLLEQRARAEEQIKELRKAIAALDVLIKIQRGETSIPIDMLQLIERGSIQYESGKEQSSKRAMMIEIVKLKGCARPKEVVAALHAKQVKVDAHYVHNELSALYKAGVLDRVKGEYFLREKKQEDKKKKTGEKSLG
ncbi:MAG TPA: hypothetical protein VN937_21295 [Blastocatellia bacterium]|nr:hypothetical protein [Blastocatellia bacterium]